MLTGDHETRNRLSIIIILLLFILSACSGGSTTVGNPGEGVTSVELTGTAQKGPFTEGGTIVIYELNQAFNQTGTSFSTEIINNLGDYTVPVEVQSTFVELFVQGFYFDEISGDLSSAQLSLNALADLSGNDSINVNILTTLSSPRIRWLIKQGAAFSDARAQAESEILTAFGIQTDSVSLFEDMTALQDGEGNAVMLAISTIVMQLAHWEDDGSHIPATLSWVISTIKHDIEADGVLNNDIMRTRIQYAKSWVDLKQVRENMETRYQAIDPSIVIPRFEDYFSPVAMTLLSAHPVGQLGMRIYYERFRSSLLALSPDESRVYLASGDDDVSDTLVIFNTNTGEIERRIPFDTEIRSLALNPSGTKLIIVMKPDKNGKTISIWDTALLMEIDSVVEDESDVGDGIWNAKVVAASTLNYKDMNAIAPSVIAALNLDSALDLSEMVYLLDSENNIVQLLILKTNDTHDFAETLEHLIEYDDVVNMTITGDDERLYILTHYTALSSDEVGRIWMLQSDTPTYYESIGYLEDEAQKIIVSPDGLYLYVITYQVNLELKFKILKYGLYPFEQYTFEYIGSVELDSFPSVSDINISPDGQSILIMYKSGHPATMVHTPTLSVANWVMRGNLYIDGMVFNSDGSKAYMLDCYGGDHELLIFNTGVHQ